MSTARPIAGWYRDPSGQFAFRYWDGDAWTARVRRDASGLRRSTVAAPAPAATARPRGSPRYTRRTASTRWLVAVWALIAVGAAGGLRPPPVPPPPPAAPARPGGPPRSPRRTASTRWLVAVWALIAVGVALIVVGALLPWREAHVGNESFSSKGIDGDGALAILLAVTAVILLVVLQHSRRLAALLIALGIVGAGFALFEIVDASRKADELVAGETGRAVTAGVGSGPWVVLVGSGLVVIGGVLALVRWPATRNRRRRTS